MHPAARRFEDVPIGIGSYTVPEASRLIKTPARNIRRWLGGYSHKNRGMAVEIPPLWTPQIPRLDDHIELGFRDLIELRFVQAFIDAGLGLKTIRNCLEYARECANDDRPFSTRRFKTDGRTIFLDSLKQSGDTELLDLKKRQFVFKRVIERSFKDLDISDEAVARWRPLNGKDTIVLDPKRAFGQPITANFGVPTVVLADALKVEGSVERVAKIYEVSASVVRDAVKFEESLLAA
ncbi:hypothetical protein IYY11_21285 [Methylocystis sp. H62]|uniref:hypothetical protein n=1 Tax=Methylocystis sp. H62 TaxID=2785789 RepID=UPI0018C3104D|nr:hypothetical protein [Methylocystis sp. H62]MBG0795895.1 hypothetical protein [Methylocystis sp. H62]